MLAEALFVAANALALVGWTLLIALPQRPWASRLACPVAIPGALCVAYGILIVANLESLRAGFGSLESVARLFENRWVLLAGWIHYLAFDLFIGAWQTRDAERLGIRRRWVVPCLVLTLMLGPLGLAFYFLVRGIARRAMSVDL
ncbi:MAG: DUF4281 domain-containing protein [Planctomycetes bacterium]|nr:DUF4281 domain-containing protein [Planctomycetota bacterium]